MKNEKIFNFFYSRLLSEKVRLKGEVVIIAIAIVGFMVHLLLIASNDLGFINLGSKSGFFSNPIAAVYTPFSFILIYEVYLLVYYLPQSTTFYIGKQYEIITLILIRNVFKDLAGLNFTTDWFNVVGDLKFSYDLAATLLLFFLIYVFYRLNEKRCAEPHNQKLISPEMERFIKLKKIIAMFLIPVFIFLAFYGVGKWVYNSFFSISQMVYSVKDINRIFFDEFFTVLILTDVLLLLFSFLNTDNFSRVIRNSGFIISTILIKLSFGIDGILSVILVVFAVLFGVLILAIHNLYDKIGLQNKGQAPGSQHV
jgi:hypothetical protein